MAAAGALTAAELLLLFLASLQYGFPFDGRLVSANVVNVLSWALLVPLIWEFLQRSRGRPGERAALIGTALLFTAFHTFFMTTVALLWDLLQHQEMDLWSRLSRWGETYVFSEFAHLGLVVAGYFRVTGGAKRRDEPPLAENRLIAWHETTRVILDLEDVSWFEACGGQVRAHVGRKAYWVRKSLKELESILAPNTFVRIHRSSIVNVDRIEEIQRWFHGDMRLQLRGGGQLNVSRRYRDRLLAVLGESE